MSKAFTKEDPEGAVEADLRPPGPPLPPGAKNYMTPAGAERMSSELDRLLFEKQGMAKETDPRIRHLQSRLDELEIVDPLTQGSPEGRALFGATVTVLQSKAHSAEKGERTYQVVGVDEASPREGRVSWASPIAKAILGSKAGDVVSLHTPQGELELEVIRVEYRKID